MGYTLLELMLALVMIAVLALVSIPSMHELIWHRHEARLSAQLVDTIHIAQQEANTRNQAVVLRKRGSDWRQGMALIVEVTSEVITVARVEMRGTLYWRSYPFYRDYLRFVPEGNAMADNGMFWYCRPAALTPSFAVLVGQAGSVEVMQPNADGVINDSRHRVLTCPRSP